MKAQPRLARSQWDSGVVTDVERLLRAPSKMIAAICPKCGGWTMFVTTESENARTWIGMCYVAGDLIIPVRVTSSLGPMCPQTNILLDERTCDL